MPGGRQQWERDFSERDNNGNAEHTDFADFRGLLSAKIRLICVLRVAIIAAFGVIRENPFDPCVLRCYYCRTRRYPSSMIFFNSNSSGCFDLVTAALAICPFAFATSFLPA